VTDGVCRGIGEFARAEEPFGDDVALAGASLFRRQQQRDCRIVDADYFISGALT
jgi:hypothetical protein